jgi:two-component system, OmpR family, response regulator
LTGTTAGRIVLGDAPHFRAGRLTMRVLIVDDHTEVLELVGRALSRDGHDVTTALNVADALSAASSYRPELVVLDLGLPDGAGEDLCRTLRERDESLAILILTAQTQVTARVRGLDAGADDYLSKPFAVAELRARVRALSRRVRGPRRTLGSSGEVELDFAARRAKRAGVEAPITAREWAILELLAANAGRVVSKAALLERVWQRQGASEAASLEVLMGRIRKKLGTDLVRTVRGEGYALAVD